eukprot:scaffold4335_cov119-Cylindrotheca_fusiformis.AAC.14
MVGHSFSYNVVEMHDSYLNFALCTLQSLTKKSFELKCLSCNFTYCNTSCFIRAYEELANLQFSLSERNMWPKV